MSNSNEKKFSNANVPPSAPATVGDVSANSYIHRPPPPSYEESQRMHGSTVNRAGTNLITNPYMSSHAYNISQQQQSKMTNYAPGTVPPPQYYQQHYVTATAPATFNNTKVANGPHVMSFAPGAVIRSSTGAVSIPPPPPGYGPTPAQYAAMQGQPVVLKKTKRSFF